MTNGPTEPGSQVSWLPLSGSAIAAAGSDVTPRPAASSYYTMCERAGVRKPVVISGDGDGQMDTWHLAGAGELLLPEMVNVQEALCAALME